MDDYPSAAGGCECVGADEDISLIDALHTALPACEIGWIVRGKRPPGYQLNAGLRVYLKQSAKAA